MDGSPFPAVEQRKVRTRLLVFLIPLVGVALALGIAPAAGHWVLLIFGVVLVVLIVGVIVFAIRTLQRVQHRP